MLPRLSAEPDAFPLTKPSYRIDLYLLGQALLHGEADDIRVSLEKQDRYEVLEVKIELPDTVR